MILVASVIFVIAMAGVPFGMAQTPVIAPKREYPQVDSGLVKETMRVLANGVSQEKQRALERFQAHPELYPPPVFYAMSGVLFEDGKKDEAAFWFYAGQLRARFDANRSANGFGMVVDLLNNTYGTPINQYMFQNVVKLEELVPKVVEWDRETPHNYDPRWVDVFLESTGNLPVPDINTSDVATLSAPKEQWDEIAEKTRSTYLSDFHEVIKIKKTGGYYEIVEGHVTFHSVFGVNGVLDADAATFSDSGGGFGKDKQHVFYRSEVVKGFDPESFVSKDADPESFVVIGPYTGKDANAIYRASHRCPQCDLQSFRKINDDLYLDKNAAYFASGSNWKRIPSADPQSVQRLSDLFSKDTQHVFFDETAIAGADPESFKIHSPCDCEFCGEDKNRCYWFGQPVPCDCKHQGNMAELPPPATLTEIPPGRAVIGTTDRFLRSSTPMDGGRRVGYLVTAPGKRTLDFKCLMHDPILNVRVTIDVEAGGFYHLKRNEDSGCEISIERATMVQGRSHDPEIRIQMPGASKPEMEVELSPGKHTFTALCRDVTRTGIREGSSDVTLELEPGKIYQLNADFKAPSNRCDVRAKLLTQ